MDRLGHGSGRNGGRLWRTGSRLGNHRARTLFDPTLLYHHVDVVSLGRHSPRMGINGRDGDDGNDARIIDQTKK